MKTRWLPALAGLLAVAAGACELSTGPVSGGAVVVFAFEGFPQDTLRVEVRDRETLRAAAAYVRTRQGPRMPIGPIVRGAGADSRYPFHFVPGSVRLAEVAMELCDGAPMRTAAEVEAFFELAGKAGARETTWCPWSAYPVEVIPST